MRPGTTSHAIDRRIGVALRMWRMRRKLSQRDVAGALCVTRPAVTLVESGARSLRLHELVRLCDAYPSDVLCSLRCVDTWPALPGPAHWCPQCGRLILAPEEVT